MLEDPELLLELLLVLLPELLLKVLLELLPALLPEDAEVLAAEVLGVGELPVPHPLIIVSSNNPKSIHSLFNAYHSLP